MSIKKPFELYKFVYRRLDGSGDYTCYIVAEHFPAAFNRIYESYGDEIKILGVEVLANESVDLVIDPTYTLTIKKQEEENTVIIRGMQDYDVK